MDTAGALAAIAAARELAAGLEHGELAFINTARDGGATWSQIAAAMGARNRQTVQKRHADLARRHPCPPGVDIPPTGPRPQETGHGDRPAARDSPAPARTGKPAPDSGNDRFPLPRPFRTAQQRTPAPRRRRPPAASGNSPCRRSPTPSSPRASTNSSAPPGITRPAPGTSWSAARASGWSVPPGGENGAGPDGKRPTTPASRCPRPESAGSRPRATPGPATQQQPACSTHSSASRKTRTGTSTDDRTSTNHGRHRIRLARRDRAIPAVPIPDCAVSRLP